MYPSRVAEAVSPFSSLQPAPADPILGVAALYTTDNNPNRVNLTAGVFRDAQGFTPRMKCVSAAEEQILKESFSANYLPMDGFSDFKERVSTLLLGPAARSISEGRLACVQALGGTGGLRLAADLLRLSAPNSSVFVSDPTWENHRTIFKGAGFSVEEYPYYDRDNKCVQWDRFEEFLLNAPSHSIIILHASCHNPTGADLTIEQWHRVRDIVVERSLVPLLDSAYAGFRENLEADLASIRLFEEAGIPFLVVCSFSKMLSLYNERVGYLGVVSGSAEEASKVLSQLKGIIRTNYSSPPAHGVRIVAEILGNDALTQLWHDELASMRDYLNDARELFISTLESKGVMKSPGLLRNQGGLFSFTGLSARASQWLRTHRSVYMIDNGRLCIAAINRQNVDYVCEAIGEAIVAVGE